MDSTPKILQTRRLRESWPAISEDDVELPSGAHRSWVRIHLGVSAAVLPVTTDRRVVLTREYRHGVRTVVHALPGGTAKEGETPEVCARRELLEETGYEPGRLLHLYQGNSLTAYLDGTLHLFFAPDCRATGRKPNPDEVASVDHLTILSALDLARRGEFGSSTVTLAILLADARGWLQG